MSASDICELQRRASRSTWAGRIGRALSLLIAKDYPLRPPVPQRRRSDLRPLRGAVGIRSHIETPKGSFPL